MEKEIKEEGKRNSKKGKEPKEEPAGDIDENEDEEAEDEDEEENEGMDDGQYEVEAILNHKKTKAGMEFLVRWKDYPPEDDCWLPAENMDCPDLVEAYWDKKKKDSIKNKRTKPESKSKREVSVSSRRSPSPYSPRKAKSGVRPNYAVDLEERSSSRKIKKKPAEEPDRPSSAITRQFQRLHEQYDGVDPASLFETKMMFEPRKNQNEEKEQAEREAEGPREEEEPHTEEERQAEDPREEEIRQTEKMRQAEECHLEAIRLLEEMKREAEEKRQAIERILKEEEDLDEEEKRLRQREDEWLLDWEEKERRQAEQAARKREEQDRERVRDRFAKPYDGPERPAHERSPAPGERKRMREVEAEIANKQIEVAKATWRQHFDNERRRRAEEIYARGKRSKAKPSSLEKKKITKVAPLKIKKKDLQMRQDRDLAVMIEEAQRPGPSRPRSPPSSKNFSCRVAPEKSKEPAAMSEMEKMAEKLTLSMKRKRQQEEEQKKKQKDEEEIFADALELDEEEEFVENEVEDNEELREQIRRERDASMFMDPWQKGYEAVKIEMISDVASGPEGKMKRFVVAKFAHPQMGTQSTAAVEISIMRMRQRKLLQDFITKMKKFIKAKGLNPHIQPNQLIKVKGFEEYMNEGDEDDDSS